MKADSTALGAGVTGKLGKSPLLGWVRGWFTPQTPQRTPEELLFTRLLFAYVLWMATPPVHWVFESKQPHPVGIANFVDLTWLSQPYIWPALHYTCALLLILYVWNIGARVVMPVFFILQVCMYTLRSSQGAVGHSMQLLTLVVLAHTIGHTLYPLWRKWRPAQEGQPVPSPQEVALNLTTQTIAAGYVICGLSKLFLKDDRWTLRLSNLDRWLGDVPNLAVQLQKTAMMDFYNALEQTAAPMQQFMLKLLIEQPGAARVVFGTGLLLELLACLALLNRRWQLALGVSLIAMHVMIEQTMRLSFGFHIWILFVFWVNVPYWLGQAYRWVTAKLRDRSEYAGVPGAELAGTTGAVPLVQTTSPEAVLAAKP